MCKYTEFNHNQFQTHRLVYDLIEKNTKVLDLGCATGYFGNELANKFVELYGVDVDSVAVKLAKKYYKCVIQSDLNLFNTDKLPKKYFDYIILLDVIEHLINPTNLLSKITKLLNKSGQLIISTPNILHISIRYKFISGKFNYEKYGILDETHVHFYTIESIVSLVSDLGYKVIKVIPSVDLGQVPIFGRFFKRIPLWIQSKIVILAPNLLATQFIVVCSH